MAHDRLWPADPSRRTFLQASAAALGAGAVVSLAGRATAQPVTAKARPKLGAGDPIRIGVIGTGGMGTNHCTSFMKLVADGKENAQIVAVADVCDSHAAKAKKVCEQGQKNDVASFRDYRDLLKRDDIHAVLIATPEHWHTQNALDAIATGKDVYVEKPMTLKVEDAVILHRACEKNPEIIFQVGTQMTQIPKYHEARKLINAGAIGKPTFSQTSYCRNSKDGEWNYYKIDPEWKPGVNLDWAMWCGPAGAAEWDPMVFARWRRYRRWSTGIIGDLLVHVLTPLVMAIDQGFPVRVNAIGGHYVDKAMENHDQVNITIQFEKEHTMIVAGSTCNEVGLETIIRGHKGNIYLGANNVVLRPERIYSEEIDEKTVICADIGNDQDVHRVAWMKSIRSREKPFSDATLGLKIMAIVDLATRSMWDGGRAYTFDPTTFAVKAV